MELQPWLLVTTFNILAVRISETMLESQVLKNPKLILGFVCSGLMVLFVMLIILDFSSRAMGQGQ
ncbi:hypothetical protein ES288_A04G031400v1 [Gossypium darwinii]|uniref:Uncharacterized protein n=2 Tax=Gossypium TaxID=3633 RepID=A0A5D2QV57_GOSTO|nr:hypothetical protein ES288_A04G031400v1 [Gossypium darwinii]TYI32063.1 hypothetical protein ES332_A04G032000v1 [Gossypium tomentosum]